MLSLVWCCSSCQGFTCHSNVGRTMMTVSKDREHIFSLELHPSRPIRCHFLSVGVIVYQQRHPSQPPNQCAASSWDWRRVVLEISTPSLLADTKQLKAEVHSLTSMHAVFWRIHSLLRNLPAMACIHPSWSFSSLHCHLFCQDFGRASFTYLWISKSIGDRLHNKTFPWAVPSQLLKSPV